MCREILIALGLVGGALGGCYQPPPPVERVCGEALIPFRVADTAWLLPADNLHAFPGAVRDGHDRFCRPKHQSVVVESFTITELPAEQQNDRTLIGVDVEADPAKPYDWARHRLQAAADIETSTGLSTFVDGHSRYVVADRPNALGALDMIRCDTQPIVRPLDGARRYRCDGYGALSPKVSLRVVFFESDIQLENVTSRNNAVTRFVERHRTDQRETPPFER